MINKIPKILSFSNKHWPKFAARELQKAVDQVLLHKINCSLMLTGGATGKMLYREIAFLHDFPVERITFYFGDERCVPPQDADSNYSLVMSSLFPNVSGRAVKISRMEGELLDASEAARRYESLVPDEIDVLILGMGLDGHIASLFPGNPALDEVKRNIVAVSQIGVTHERITITPKVIARSKAVFLLATGREKGALLAKALTDSTNYKALPVCLTVGGTWLLDKEAEMEILTILKDSDSIY